MFRQFKGLIGILLINLLLFVSVLTIAPAPAKAGNFNFDGSVIEINQKFEGPGDRNYNDMDDIDVLITVIFGATAIIVGSAYFVWYSVSQIPNMIKRELPVKSPESDNTVSPSALTEIHS
jgi:hypothetical protein